MSLVWSDEFDDEEELKRLSGVRIRELYFSAPQDKKPQIAKIAAEKLVDLENEGLYDVLGNLKVVTDYNDNTTEGKVDVNYNKVYQTFIKRNESYDKDNSDKNLSELSKLMDTKTLLNIVKISASKLDSEIKNSDNYKDIETNDALLAKGIEEKLKDPKAYSPDAEERFYDAGSVGTLDNVSEDAKKQFLMTIAKETGWEKATKESIIATDKKLFDNITPLDVYIEKDGQKTLNPLFDGCVELAGNIAYDFPDGTDDATKQNLTNAYNQQLMANALQRATHDVLKNPSLLGKGESKEEIEESFKNLIADNFSRSVVVAGLATSPNTTDGITIDKNTGRVDYDKSDALASEIEEILKGQRKISPLAVSLDTHQLGIETSRCEKVLKTVKNVDTEKLPFYKKVLAVGKAAWNNVVKQGGWKKIAVNGLMFGGAAVAMASGASAVVAAGSIVYAGWTAANAWVAPVWDKLSAEMREKKITGFKNKLAYRLKNWKRAREQKYAEPGFKERAAWRTVEGVGMAAVSGALGLSGATPWVKTLTRQGAMVVGKSSSLARSWFKKKTAAEKLAEQYSVANYQALQTAEGYLKQDKVALAAVVGFSAIADVAKATDLADSFGEQLSDITEKVKAVQTPEVTPAPEVEVTPEAETPATENGTTPEAETPATTTKNIDINDLDNDHKKMFLNSHKKWENTNINKYIGSFEKEGYHVSGNFTGAEKGIVQEFYNAIQNGQVESCPEGMSPVEYVDKLTRLMQLAPGEQRKGIELMIRDLLCEDYVPSEADKQTVAEALNTIRYDKGTSQCVILDGNGNPCVKSMPNFGNYFGQRKVVDIQLENGETVTLPVRTANVTVALGTEVDCAEGTGRISNVYVRNQVDCGCDDVEVESKPEPGPKSAPKSEPKPEPKPEDLTAGGNDIEAEGSKDVETPKKQISVNMRDPYAVSSSVQSGEELPINTKFIGGKAMAYRTKGFETVGVLRVWNKEGVVFLGNETDNENNLIQTEDIDTGINGRDYTFHMANKLEDVIAKLPDAPTKVIEAEDGSITYTYEFGKGDNFRVVIDAPKEGEEARIGHFYIGKKEVIIDEKAADALMTKMSNNPSMQFTSVDGDEQSGDVIERIEINKAITRKMQDYKEDLIKKMENPVSPSENAEHIVPKITTEDVEIAATQRAEIMKETTELQLVKFEDETAVLSVKGANGFNNIRVPKPVHVDYDLAKHQPVATVGENNNYTVEITTADEQKMLVTIADGKASTTLNGKPVVLDTDSSTKTENLVELALKKQNVNMNLTLHNEYTKKIISAIEQGSNNQQITALNRATPNTVSLASQRASAHRA